MKKWLDRYADGGQTPAKDNTTVYHNAAPKILLTAGPKLPAPSYISATPDYKDSEWYKQESEDLEMLDMSLLNKFIFMGLSSILSEKYFQ
jgi:hypothetical protein